MQITEKLKNIISQGEGLTVEFKKATNNYEPFPKNPDIARIFTQIGYSEELGTGIANVYKFSLPYSNTKNILFNEDDIFITEIPLNNVAEEVNDPVNDPVNARQKQLLAIIAQNKYVTRAILSDTCKVSVETIKRDIRKLRALNLIKRVGSDKTGHWKRCSEV